MVKGPLKYHGGKAYLAKRIIAMFPPRGTWIHYVEPYFGGGSVLLENDPEGISEVVNDLNEELTNFWITLQNADTWRDFCRIVQAVPFSEVEFGSALTAKVFGSDVDRAVNFFIVCRQSLAGRMKSFTGITRTRTRRGMNNEVSAWLTAVEGLPAVHERMKRVLILNRDAVDVVVKEDSPKTLFYLDPPYLHETRATTSDYAHEMTRADHKKLLNALGNVRGRFLLSGYRSDLYDDFAKHFGWNREDITIPNHAAGGKSKRIMTECVWKNF